MSRDYPEEYRRLAPSMGWPRNPGDNIGPVSPRLFCFSVETKKQKSSCFLSHRTQSSSFFSGEKAFSARKAQLFAGWQKAFLAAPSFFRGPRAFSMAFAAGGLSPPAARTAPSLLPAHPAMLATGSPFRTFGVNQETRPLGVSKSEVLIFARHVDVMFT